jgi:hypothetical protein
MPERRSEPRPGAPDRRSFPRPPLWLNLAVLFLGIAGVLFARYHRERVSDRFENVIAEDARTPADVRKVKTELAEMDLTRDQLQRELEARLKHVAGLKSEGFYLSIDSKEQKFRFYYGDTILREGHVVAGESRKVQSRDGRTWTFVPLKGAFHVEGKAVGYDWQVPEWLYAMRGERVPQYRPVVSNGLGRYVLFLPHGYVIHTPPSEDSPLQGAKPGSFLVSESDLAPIWSRIERGRTMVYVY